jgi:hypothetical protein
LQGALLLALDCAHEMFTSGDSAAVQCAADVRPFGG